MVSHQTNSRMKCMDPLASKPIMSLQNQHSKSLFCFMFLCRGEAEEFEVEFTILHCACLSP